MAESFRGVSRGWRWRRGCGRGCVTRRSARTRPRVGGRQVAARACTNAAGGRRFGGRQSRGQQSADHSGQHVAGPGGGRPGLPGRVEVDRAAGFGDDGDVALQQHGRAELRRRACGWRAMRSSPGGEPGQPGELPRMRGQHGRRACGRRAGRGARPGWSARRRRPSPAGRCPARTTVRRRRLRRCPAPARRPRPAPGPPRPGSATRSPPANAKALRCAALPA